MVEMDTCAFQMRQCDMLSWRIKDKSRPKKPNKSSQVYTITSTSKTTQNIPKHTLPVQKGTLPKNEPKAKLLGHVSSLPKLWSAKPASQS